MILNSHSKIHYFYHFFKFSLLIFQLQKYYSLVFHEFCQNSAKLLQNKLLILQMIQEYISKYYLNQKVLTFKKFL